MIEREGSSPLSQPHYDLQLAVLEVLQSARNYNHWITDFVVPAAGDNPIEIGSGLGDQAQSLLDKGLQRVTVSDLEPAACERLRERFAAEHRVTVRWLDLERAEQADYSSVIAINVLEHIEDDVGALRAAVRLVADGGHIIVFVPAGPWAMSRFDRAIGHIRRYTRSSLTSRLKSAGVEPVVVRYVNAPGLLAWFVLMRLLRRTAKDGALVRVWDKVVVPLTRRVEGRIPPPFGQSLFAVAVVRRSEIGTPPASDRLVSGLGDQVPGRVIRD